MSVCWVYLGAGGLLTERHSGCPSSPPSEVLLEGEAYGGFRPTLDLLGEGKTAFTSVPAPDLCLAIVLVGVVSGLLLVPLEGCCWGAAVELARVSRGILLGCAYALLNAVLGDLSSFVLAPPGPAPLLHCK